MFGKGVKRMNSNKHCIFYLSSHQVTPALKLLFDPSDPTSLRCFAVLEGNAQGRIFADHPLEPTWSVVHEAASGRLFLGGRIHYPSLRKLFLRLHRHGNLWVGLSPDDPRWQFLPRRADQRGFSLDFTDRQPRHADGIGLSVPSGCKLQRLDLSLFEHCIGKSKYLSMYGSAQQALQKGQGLCLTNSHELLCEAFAGPISHRKIEITTSTHANYRDRGYATLTCTHLITQMEQQGYRTYFSCNRENHASVALARRLGYQTEREYRLLAWLKAAD